MGNTWNSVFNHHKTIYEKITCHIIVIGSYHTLWQKNAMFTISFHESAMSVTSSFQYMNKRNPGKDIVFCCCCFVVVVVVVFPCDNEIRVVKLSSGNKNGIELICNLLLRIMKVLKTFCPHNTDCFFSDYVKHVLLVKKLFTVVGVTVVANKPLTLFLITFVYMLYMLCYDSCISL